MVHKSRSIDPKDGDADGKFRHSVTTGAASLMLNNLGDELVNRINRQKKI